MPWFCHVSRPCAYTTSKPVGSGWPNRAGPFSRTSPRPVRHFNASISRLDWVAHRQLAPMLFLLVLVLCAGAAVSAAWWRSAFFLFFGWCLGTHSMATATLCIPWPVTCVPSCSFVSPRRKAMRNSRKADLIPAISTAFSKNHSCLFNTRRVRHCCELTCP